LSAAIRPAAVRACRRVVRKRSLRRLAGSQADMAAATSRGAGAQAGVHASKRYWVVAILWHADDLSSVPAAEQAGFGADADEILGESFADRAVQGTARGVERGKCGRGELAGVAVGERIDTR